MNIIFFGSSKHSTIVADAVQKEFGLKLIVTIPDKPVGRKKILTPGPVKEFAIKNTIPVLTFDALDKNAIEKIKNVHSDFLVVDDYRLILPKDLLQIPKYAALNVHHSLLPKYRGPSPAPAAILAGEQVTGVTIMKMREGVDTGDILAQEKYTMQGNETTQTLLTILNILGAKIIIPVIKNFEKITPTKQDESQATHTKRYAKEDAYIDSNNPPSPEQLDRMIRAFYPWPCVWTKLRIMNHELRIKLIPNLKRHAELFEPEPQSRRLVSASSEITMRSRNKSFDHELKTEWFGMTVLLQAEGKNPMTVKDFLNGYPETKQMLERLFGE